MAKAMGWAYTEQVKRFGLLIDWVSSAFHQELWMGIQAFCRDRGVNLLTLVAGRPGSPLRWEQLRSQLLEFVDGRSFDGFLFMTATLGNHLGSDQLRQLVDRVAPSPVVSIGAEIEGVASVVVDHRHGFRQILRHLVFDHGFRRLAFAGGPDYNADARERAAVFADFVDEHNLESPPKWRCGGDFTSAWGREAVSILIPGEKPEFDALVCASDDIALGALEGLAHKNLTSPGDLAVTGFDDVFSSGLAALTTARQPLATLGWTAASLLADIADRGIPSRVQRLESSLVIRQSCGCLSPAATAAQVAPQSAWPDDFLTAVKTGMDRLLEELSMEGLPGSFARSLRDSFLEAWNQQDGRSFLHRLALLLSDMADGGLGPSKLQYPLSILRKWVLMSTEPAARRSFTETLIHQSRIILTEVLHAQDARSQTHQALLNEELSTLNERLIYARSFAEQAEILLDTFPRLGIEQFRLALYEDAAAPMKSARLLLTERGPLAEGISFDPRRLFSAGFEPPSEPWSWVAEALFERSGPLGFVLLDAQGDAELLSVFDQLCERVGRGVETVRRIEDLQRQVDQRTAELSRALVDVEANNRQLKELALTDSLTGLHNRRGFMMLAEHQYKLLTSRESDAVLFFIDLDGLKRVNDTWGHDAGDQAIQSAAQALLVTFRAQDIVARLGGDEFVVLAPDGSEAWALLVEQRLRSEITDRSQGRFGMSVGRVSFQGTDHETLSEWMKRADEKLYQEKLSKGTIQPKLKRP